MVTPGPHDTSEMTELSQEVLDLPSHPPSSELGSFSLHAPSTGLMPYSSATISCSSVSTPSSISLCSPILSTSSGPQVSSISPSFSPSYSSIPFPSTTPTSSSDHKGNTVDVDCHSHFTAAPFKPSMQVGSFFFFSYEFCVRFYICVISSSTVL